MPKIILVLLLLCVSGSGISQQQFNSDHRISLENCAFRELDSSRIDCYSDILRDLFLADLNTHFTEVGLKPGEVVQTQIEIELTVNGAFRLKSIDTDHEKIESLLSGKLASLERVLPLQDSQGNNTSNSFSMILASHLDEEGNIASGLPKQKVGGFEDMVAPVAFSVIENVPVYPGCEGDSNLELKDCMSQKVQEHVLTNFNSELAASLDLPGGIQRIYVNFTIDKTGKVSKVKTRASHPDLAAEAKRVIDAIPQMIPGKQKGRDVGVMYSLPIVFMVEESAKEKRARLKREKKMRQKI